MNGPADRRRSANPNRPGRAGREFAGAGTIAQDQASSVVFGMPKVAIEMDAAQQILALSQVAQGALGALLRPRGGRGV